MVLNYSMLAAGEGGKSERQDSPSSGDGMQSDHNSSSSIFSVVSRNWAAFSSGRLRCLGGKAGDLSQGNIQRADRILASAIALPASETQALANVHGRLATELAERNRKVPEPHTSPSLQFQWGFRVRIS